MSILFQAPSPVALIRTNITSYASFATEIRLAQLHGNVMS